MGRLLRLLTSTTAVGLTVLAASGSAQQQQQPPPATQPPDQPPPQPPQATFRAGINYVRVDVIVTQNKDGVPVADLQPTDFEVLEDNKPQKIDAFKLIKLDGGTAESIKEP